MAALSFVAERGVRASHFPVQCGVIINDIGAVVVRIALTVDWPDSALDLNVGGEVDFIENLSILESELQSGGELAGDVD